MPKGPFLICSAIKRYATSPHPFFALVSTLVSIALVHDQSLYADVMYEFVDPNMTVYATIDLSSEPTTNFAIIHFTDVSFTADGLAALGISSEANAFALQDSNAYIEAQDGVLYDGFSFSLTKFYPEPNSPFDGSQIEVATELQGTSNLTYTSQLYTGYLSGASGPSAVEGTWVEQPSNATPEPSTLLMTTILGGLGLVAERRRRRKAPGAGLIKPVRVRQTA